MLSSTYLSPPPLRLLSFLTTFFVFFSNLTTLTVATSFARIVEHDQLLSRYDYIVAGGGVAGLTVADRLSENINNTVLVIESGQLDLRDPGVLVPGLVARFGEPAYMFNITCTPQPQLENRTFPLLAAHVLAGGSVVNGMFFDRGSPSDYDIWAELGNEGWGWDDLLPYFRKSERFTPPSETLRKEFGIGFDPRAHGFDEVEGRVNSSYPEFVWPGVKRWFGAFRELGFRMPVDGTIDALGAFWVPNSLNPANQSRSYARDAHFEDAVVRPNYHILLGQTVTKVLINAENIVTGVAFAASENTTVSSVSVNKEVIIAAGAAHSPQILMLSGIGPAPLLESLGIPVYVDLPGVGQNLQEHSTTAVGAGQFANDLPLNPSLLNNATFAAAQLAAYFANRTGPFTNNFGVAVAMATFSDISLAGNNSAIEALASLIRSLKSQPAAAFLPNSTHPSILRGYAKQKALLADNFADNHIALSELAFGATPSLPLVPVHPLSRGILSITSTSPFVAPRIDWRTFTHPLDLSVLVAATRLVNTLLATQPLSELQPTEFLPAVNATDEEIGEFIRGSLFPNIGHVCCTAPMMKREYGGVVDKELRVYGVRGVRVVDASLMPVVPATHISSTVYAVAEKAAGLILRSA